MAQEYRIVHRKEHVEVFRGNEFWFSADNEIEAMREIREEEELHG